MKYLLSIILNVAVGQNVQSVKIAVGQKCRRPKLPSVKNSVGQNGRRSKLPSVKNSVGQSCVGQKTWNRVCVMCIQEKKLPPFKNLWIRPCPKSTSP
jgi:hypothetical protein